MGILAPGSVQVHARPSARPPIDMRENKDLPQPLRSRIRSYGNLGQLFENTPLSTQNLYSAGASWGPQFLFWCGILIFLLLRAS